MRIYRVWNMLHDDVKFIVKGLEIARAHSQVDVDTGDVIVLMPNLVERCTAFEARVIVNHGNFKTLTI